MKANKFRYILVIQQNYGCGWEDCSEYETNSTYSSHDKSLVSHDMREYRLLGYSTRLIKRKEVIK